MQEPANYWKGYLKLNNMSESVIKTTKVIEHLELVNIVEQAYGISKNDFRIEMDKNGCGFVHVESLIDKGAGLALDITNGGMKAKLSLFPPLNFGGRLDTESVEDFLLNEKKLDTELINWDKFKECFRLYEEGYIVYQEVIAEGIEKVDGNDATYELHFELTERKPKVLADGRVDFKDINNIVMVQEDDKLLTYFAETEGIDGKTVQGDELIAVKGKKININKGNGVEFNEEDSIYYATLAGHITFNKMKLNVNPVYNVDGDVDYSEGNVDFQGTVKISGDVLSGFSVRAKNIIVWGIARDAELIAEEDITVRTGIVSTGKGVTRAGNTVTTEFIEGAEVHAGIAVVIKNHCYNSKIYSEGEILALSGDGILNGGEFYAFSNVEAKRIGQDNSSSFLIHVGVKHFLEKRIEELLFSKESIEKRLKTTDKTIKMMAGKNPNLKEKEQIKTIISDRNKLYKRYESIDKEIETLIKKSMHPMPYVLAKESIGEGIKVVIYNTEHIVPLKTPGAKFIFNQNTGHVVMVRPDEDLEYDPKKRK